MHQPTLSNRHQQGVALFIVIVFVMLLMLLALWASRTSIFNEMVIGNDADYQRTLEAAQALMQDAEYDIQGVKANGLHFCDPSGGTSDTCRPDGSTVQFPLEDKDVGDLIDTLTAATTTANCWKGICLKRVGSQDFWNDKMTLTAMQTANAGARYGQFTGGQVGSYSNPILSKQDPTKPLEGGWYWVEIMNYEKNAGNSGLITNGSQSLALTPKPSVAYRITAIAYGLKPSTRVVLQSTFVRQHLKN